jgi:hypothetical protein
VVDPIESPRGLGREVIEDEKVIRRQAQEPPVVDAGMRLVAPRHDGRVGPIGDEALQLPCGRSLGLAIHQHRVVQSFANNNVQSLTLSDCVVQDNEAVGGAGAVGKAAHDGGISTEGGHHPDRPRHQLHRE